MHNRVAIGNKKHSSYIYAIFEILKNDYNTIELLARGRYISKLFDVEEILKKYFPNLEIIEIKVGTDTVPANHDKLRNINLTTIELKLKLE